MGLEVFGFINDLNPSFPFGSDDVSEGDDHLRGVKETLQNTFPSNDGPGSFPNMDFFLRDMDLRTITVSGQIQSSEQVAIALSTLDGLTGNITGPNFGIISSTRIAVGEYEIQLEEQTWTSTEDLQAALSVNNALAGIGVGMLVVPSVNTGPGWIRIITQFNTSNNATQFDDCALLHFAIFDAGRD